MDSTSGNHKDKAKDKDNFRHYGANIENRCNSKTDKVNQKRGANEGFTYGLEYYANTYNSILFYLIVSYIWVQGYIINYLYMSYESFVHNLIVFEIFPM